ncbi:MAG: dihydroorotate dehydrogenase electron transfer subunit [Desulfosarcinaceae bacterium]|nr:dihydroorotate dehydrogenase electron transfer subunit [Desulfosarcinaceae bacterium]
MLQFEASVLWNAAVSEDVYHLGLTAPSDFGRARPGQFVMVRIPRAPGALLRRPFSIHKLIFDGGRRVSGFELLYKTVGKGTHALINYRIGDTLPILGPLGSSFSANKPWRRVFLVAGGIGVAPMPFLADRLLAKRLNPEDCHVFIGGQSAADLLCQDDFRALGVPLTLTTDDGSAGDQCLITHPVEAALDRSPPDALFACGPMPMLACLAGFLEQRGIFAQVSVESMMACGMGACLGCALPVRDTHAPYRHACIDGPVFDLDQIAV